MPKNKGKKLGNINNITRDLRLPMEHEFIAVVRKNIGDLRFRVADKDSREHTAKLKGSIVKKCRLTPGSMVLVESVLNLNEITYVYTSTEAKELIDQEYFTLSKEDGNNDIVDFSEEVNIDDI